MDALLRQIKKIIPQKLFEKLQPLYHYSLALVAALIYRFPSRKIKVVAITGTKGKSSTTEILNALLEAAGKKTAVAGTIRIKIGDTTWPNMYKMTVPGRFFLQKFLRQAVNAGCEYAILEMTSGAVMQFRHKFIDLDSLIFLNISPEHIEQHGSFENYLAAKLSLAKALEQSKKPHRILVVNGDDKESDKFLRVTADEKYSFTLQNAEPYILDDFGLYLSWHGRNIRSHLQGLFNIYNILAALTYAATQGVTPEIAEQGLEKLSGIPGRVEKIQLQKENNPGKKQAFTVVVDYAHTADSLEKLYQAFSNKQKICVLGNTGGGRDKWKRPEMGKVADTYCHHIILTNEDPYDEDPKQIIDEMVPGIASTPFEIVLDRREAIHKAITLAKAGDAVLITGKGTDPYIMEANGKKTPWSDSKVAREELEKVLGS